MTALMQAVQIDQYGGPDVLQLRRLPIPTPIEGEVVVNGKTLLTGDAAAISDERQIELSATRPSQVLLFDLN